MTILILTIALVVVLAAVFSCIEAAIFCTSYPRAQVLKRQGRAGAAALIAIRENMSRPVTTLVIGTNITTIVGSLFVGHVATEAFGDEAIGIISAVVTFLIIIFGEIFPKVLGERYAEHISLFAAPPLLFITNIFTPLIWVIEKATNRFADHSRKIVSEEELKILSEIGSKEGSIERDEEELIRRVFTLNDMSAKDIMTPRKVMDSLKATDTVESITAVVHDKPYSRYPVIGSSLDDIVGICQAKDLLIHLSKEGDDALVSKFMTPPLFVPQNKRVDDLLAFFLASRGHMAIVRDDAGKTVGVVTFEDVLEQLVGEIIDETDEIVDLRQDPIPGASARTSAS